MKMDVYTGLVIFICVLKCHSLENLAVFRNASMSSREFLNKWPASAAVDNNTNQRLEGNSCAHTDFGQRTVSWTVDLGRILAFSNVTIYYRDENDGISHTFRLSGFSIFSSNDPNVPFSTNCYRNNNGEQTNPGPSSIFTAPCNSYGRYISLYKDRSSTCRPLININTCAIFELCEVQVFGCQAQFYGPNCLNRCPSNCLNDICNIDSGLCFDCKVGYNGSRCESPCPFGTYGQNCREKCSGNCRNNATCNTADGTCVSCSPGWQGSMCRKTCEAGTYGDCRQLCGICLNNTACNRFDGTCSNGCGEGGVGQLCLPGDRQQVNVPENQAGSGGSSLTVGIIVGILILIIIIIVVVVILKRRANKLQTKYKRQSQHYKIDYRQGQDTRADDKIEERYANTESIDVYSKVDKSKTNGQNVPSDVYAEVQKNKHVVADVDVYAEVEKNRGNGNAPDETNRNVNQDGLVYLDVEFSNANTNNGQRTLVTDNQTEYASVQFTGN